MKKIDWAAFVGVLSLLTGLIWGAVRAWPNMGFRYDHPEMTDTQLQIHFLSRLRWSDLVPAALALSGLFLLLFAATKKK